MTKTLERPQPTGSNGDKEGRRHVLADDGIREAYHEVRKLRLQGAASAAGVVRPGNARLAREQALKDAHSLANPGEYHIPQSEGPETQR